MSVWTVLFFHHSSLKYPKHGKSIPIRFRCGSTFRRFSSGCEPLVRDAGPSLLRESGSVFLLPRRRQRLSRGYMWHCQPVREKPQDDHAAKWQMPNINVSLRAELTFTTHGRLPSITADGLMWLDAEKLWQFPSYSYRIGTISLAVGGSDGKSLWSECICDKTGRSCTLYINILCRTGTVMLAHTSLNWTMFIETNIMLSIVDQRLPVSVLALPRFSCFLPRSRNERIRLIF